MNVDSINSMQWAMAHAHVMIEYFPESFQFALNDELYVVTRGPQYSGEASFQRNSIACLVRDMLRTGMKGETVKFTKYDSPQMGNVQTLSKNTQAQLAIIDAIHSLTGRKPNSFNEAISLWIE